MIEMKDTDPSKPRPPAPPNRYQSPENYDDPASFWRAIGKDYIKLLELNGPAYQLQETAFMRLLNRHFHYVLTGTEGPSIILELGAGFGRMTKKILEAFDDTISAYIAIDCSHDQLERMLNEWLPKRFLPILIAKEIDILSPEYDKALRPYRNKVDLLVCSEFLMHVPPSDLDWVMNRAIDTLKPDHKGAMINVDWSLPLNKGPVSSSSSSPECFLYDYQLRYQANPKISIIDIKHLPEINQSIFIAY
jgi:SAM-dependent methyltransferase